MLPLEGLTSTALFSDCGTYRYTLVRVWDQARPRLNFVGLNPSTADAIQNDPTITRVLERARRGGFGSLVVTNLYALRSTDPRALATHPDPVGPLNDGYLIEEAAFADVVLVGWGSDRTARERARQVLERFAGLERLDLRCLGINRDGAPIHPLYVPYARELVRYG